jgi:hypothetical protein
MTPCSPTPSSPTRSPRRDGPRRIVAALLLCTGLAHAHEDEHLALPGQPGWRVGGGLALDVAAAQDPWPVARHEGVLLTGQTARDRRNELSLEHVAVGAAARFTPWLAAQLDLGLHDRDQAHVEVARVEASWNAWRLRAGRQSPSLGGVVDGAGHFDSFAQAPLAKQAVFNETWIDDGLSLQWQQPAERGLQALELGAWRARAFPAGPHGPVAPSLKATAVWDHWTAHLFGAWLQPQGRGAAAVSKGTVGHSHGVPDCRLSVANRVCFDGQAQVYGASLSGASDDERWAYSAAGLWRRERGALYTQTGTAHYEGDTAGLWADVSLRWRPDLTVALRAERLALQHSLNGPGASLVATAAGLSAAPAVHRLALALGSTRLQPVTLWLETGAEQTSGAPAQPYVVLRAVWQAPQWLGGKF